MSTQSPSSDIARNYVPTGPLVAASNVRARPAPPEASSLLSEITIEHGPLDLLGRGSIVDRHADGACGPDRVVDDRPLVPRAGHQADPVAGSDTGGDQSLGQGRHLVAELADRDILPASCAAGAAQRDLPRIGGGAPGYDPGEAGRIGDLHESWDGVLTHDAFSLSRALAAAAHVIA